MWNSDSSKSSFEFSTAVAGIKAVSRKSELVLNLGKSGDGFLRRILPGEKGSR